MESAGWKLTLVSKSNWVRNRGDCSQRNSENVIGGAVGTPNRISPVTRSAGGNAQPGRADAGCVRRIRSRSVDSNQEVTRRRPHAYCLAVPAVSHRAGTRRRVARNCAADSFPLCYALLLSFSPHLARYKIMLLSGAAPRHRLPHDHAGAPPPLWKSGRLPFCNTSERSACCPMCRWQPSCRRARTDGRAFPFGGLPQGNTSPAEAGCIASRQRMGSAP